MFFTALIFGALAGSLALIIEIVVLNVSGSLTTASSGADFTNLAIVALAVLIEEITRLLFLRQFFKRFLATVTPTWPALCFIGLCYGLGYATLELGLIVGQGATAFFGLAGIVLVHTALSVFFAFSLSRVLPFALTLTFGLAVILHFLYNLSLILS